MLKRSLIPMLLLCAIVSTVEAQELKIAVTAVTGVVQTRTAVDQPWQRAQVGMALTIGSEVRTGFRSAIEIKIEGGHTLVLDRMSTVKMLEAIKADGKIKTDLGMKYGRVRYDVKSAGEEVDAKIHAPSATLAVRGSTVEFLDDALSSYARGSGRLAYLPLDRRTEIAFGGNGEAEVNDDSDSAVEVAREGSVVNALGMFSATTTEEFNNLLVKSGLVDSHQRDVLEIQRLLDELEVGGIGVPQLTGPLDINLFWNTLDFSPGDLDLTVTDPSGNVLSVNNPVVGQPPTQGTFNLADDGAFGFGQENAQWSVLFDGGTYQLNVNYVAGTAPADVFLTATEGPGFTIVPPADGTPFQLSPGQNVTVPITPVGP